ncbi:hypothetical protein [Beggiatoa leptomitoformis]|uniref:Uncharacterized protein n=1 Tax=Beggiatoa leptomitoformis TaxID=288004 RepID=A0A2N9YDH1_9GAMM|nr:hypothetical protein [Beggiatoa leptomitoformis]ALG69053.1 hypothetical protein AL038_16890 [Beggiatoa leptomitoformis]AUI68538.1 hypothetical protein BLE401_07350 [Beggiatoa leptomitoformis]
MLKKPPSNVTTQADEVVAVESQLQATLSRELNEFRLIAEQLKGSLVDFHQQSVLSDEWMNDVLRRADLLYQDSASTFADDSLKMLRETQLAREVSEKTRELEAELAHINQLKTQIAPAKTDYSDMRDQQEIERLEKELLTINQSHHVVETPAPPKKVKDIKNIDLSSEVDILVKKLRE